MVRLCCRTIPNDFFFLQFLGNLGWENVFSSYVDRRLNIHVLFRSVIPIRY